MNTSLYRNTQLYIKANLIDLSDFVRCLSEVSLRSVSGVCLRSVSGLFKLFLSSSYVLMSSLKYFVLLNTNLADTKIYRILPMDREDTELSKP